jgi:NADH-quinone oxidoreductase subunit E
MRNNITVEKILLEFDPVAQNLLLALKKISKNFGYICEKDSQKIAEYFEFPITKIYETASFYDLVETKKPANLEIKVCSGGDCNLGQSTNVIREIENHFRIRVGDKFNPKVRLKKISCLGRCGDGPIVIVNRKVYERVTASSIYKIFAEWI